MAHTTAVSLCVVLMVVVGSNSKDTYVLITCDAGSFPEGEAASIACDFPAATNVSKVYMEHYTSAHPEPGSGTNIVACSQLDERQNRQCNVTRLGGYMLSEATSNRVTVNIHAVSNDQAGMYMCYAKPSEGTRHLVCPLTVTGSNNDRNKGGRGGHQNMWAIVSVILLIVTLCLIGIIVFIWCKRRLVRKGGFDQYNVKFSPVDDLVDVTSVQPLLPTVKPEIKTALSDFELTTDKIKTFMGLMDEQLGVGLQENSQVETDVKMLPSFVRCLPDGTESGAFLVVEFGSESLMVMLVDVKDADMRSAKTQIPQDVRHGTSVQLFDFIADGVSKFITSKNIHLKRLPLALVFSFPCKQSSLTQAYLTEWTKGFNCSGVVGQDLGHLLSEALGRKAIGAAVQVVAILNNGVDKLLSVAQTDHNCRVGLVIGNGFNACYMDEHVKHMIINTEWGGLGNKGCLDFIRTEFDRALDTSSINKNKQTLEKMVSRVCMGELLRLVLEKLHKDGLLFNDASQDCALYRQNGLDGSHVPKIESDTDEHYVCTKFMLNELGLENYTEEDCRIVHYACTVISERAACLAAASLATLLNRMDKLAVTVAVEGPVYRFHPHFKERLSAKMEELVNPCLKFKLVSSHGRRGLGAALAGAMAQRVQKAGGNSLLDKLTRKKTGL
ncbi:hexokinase-4-like isoform X2 [Littorina saxatilis]|uniref:hexokinase-4-like isoform X2 n=1 Tax=Littorina saxatilis TaxID=31220 RepID=UPI0038B42E19